MDKFTLCWIILVCTALIMSALTNDTQPECTTEQLTEELTLHLDDRNHFMWADVPVPQIKPIREG